MATEITAPEVEVPAEAPVEAPVEDTTPEAPVVAADTSEPANTAAVITAEDVEQHLDVDPNDPRNVPQPGLLPLTTDADQQAPARDEPVSTADQAESLPVAAGDVEVADGVVAHLDADPNDPRRFLAEFGAK